MYPYPWGIHDIFFIFLDLDSNHVIMVIEQDAAFLAFTFRRLAYVVIEFLPPLPDQVFLADDLSKKDTIFKN